MDDYLQMTNIFIIKRSEHYFIKDLNIIKVNYIKFVMMEN